MFNVGIIGCGTVHRVHADALADGKHTRLTAISGGAHITLAAGSDMFPRNAMDTVEKFGCTYYADYHELLGRKDIDAVHICTPHYLHARMAIEAMRAGKHVLVEKPLTMNAQEGREVLQTAADTGMHCGVCYQKRYNRIYAGVKQLLTSGRSGELRGARAIVTWHRDREYYRSAAWRGTWKYEGGGVLINQAIHTIDLLAWLIGLPERVLGYIDTRLLADSIEVEDTAEATMLYPSGAAAILYATNCYSHSASPLIELEFENCIIRMEDTARIRWNNGVTEYIQDREEPASSLEGAHHRRLIFGFYAALADRAPFPVDACSALSANQIVDGIYLSSKTGKYISL